MHNIKRKILSVAMSASLAITSLQLCPVEKSYAATSYAGDFDATYAYDGKDLGCNYSKESTTFKVWSPTASKVVLVRYKTGDGADKIEEVEMTGGTQKDRGVWSCTIKGDILNTYYTYKIITPENGEAEACDIYANSVGVNGNRAMVVDMYGEDTIPSRSKGDATDWDMNYTRTKSRLSDMVTWEVHIRDFSYDKSSGIKDEYKGKYLAFTQKGTTLNNEGNIQTGIDYLKSLGITHVQILPMYDYGSVDENNSTPDSAYNWGYDPKNYNAPEGSYSTNAKDGNVRVKELREMIQSLHDAGIKVIMDVVYNHTYMKGSHEEAWFDETVPKYYYRTDNTSSTGNYTNGSGCGNETRSESAMYRKFMRDSIMHWAKDYNLDGFRFDLMGLHDVETMNLIRADLDKEFGEGTMIMYGEGWIGGESGINATPAMKENVRSLNNIGFFNDQIRDAAQGERKPDGTIGLAQQGYKTGKLLEDKWCDNVYGGIKGSVGKSAGQYWMWRGYWSDSSDKTVSYDSCHDNLALWDKLISTDENTKKGNIEYAVGDFNATDEKYIRMNRLVGGYVLTSHGGSFLHAGEEFARSKNGNENSYNSTSSENAIDWNRLKTYSSIQKYYQGMIGIRRVFSGFRNTLTESGNNDKPNGSNFEWIETEGSVSSIAYYLTNNVKGEWNKVAVMINNTTQDRTYNLKASDSWVLVSDGENADIKGVKTVNSSDVTVPAKSVAVAVPKDTFDANPNVGDILKKNAAPVISGVEDQTVNVGSKVEVTVSASDADGDEVTLAAKDLPKGAEFDTKTGKFTWDSATEGEYTITFTASDGTNTSTQTLKLTVTSPASALKSLIQEVESSGLGEDNLCKTTLETLNTALKSAREVAEKDTPGEEECSKEVKSLKAAYETALKEKGAYDDLKGSIQTVEDKLKTATGDDYDAKAVADAKAVVEESKTLLEAKGIFEAYYYAMDNLKDASDAVVSNLSVPQVHVSTSYETPHIYVWTAKGNISKAYPGDKLTEKDSAGNYIYVLPADEKYNIIINNGDTSNKTNDLKGLSGDITIKVEGTTGIVNATTECKPISTGKKEVNKESLKTIIKIANDLNKSDYNNESFEAMEKVLAESVEVMGSISATQVEVNQQARKLRSSVLALGTGSTVITPTTTPDVTTSPTTTPDVTTSPTITPDVTTNPTTPDVTTNPTSTPIQTEVPRIETTAPMESAKPTTEPMDTVEPKESEIPSETVIPKESNTPEASKNPETATPSVSKNPVPTQSPNGNTDLDHTIAPKPTQSTVPQNTPFAKKTFAPVVTEKPNDVVVKKVTFNPRLTQVAKKPVKITISGKGGSGKYKYKLKITDSKGKASLIIENNKKNTYSWTPKASGTYKGYVEITDTETGKVSKRKSFTYVVVKKKLSITEVKISKKKIVKKNVSFEVKATGGKTKYQYAFIIKDKKGNIVKQTKNYQASKKFTWKFSKTGTYTVYIKVKDATKTIKTTKKVIKITK